MKNNGTAIIHSIDHNKVIKHSGQYQKRSMILPARKLSTYFVDRNHLDSSELIVNNQPDLPLKVPLEKSSLAASVRVELLKKKNLERFEGVAHRLKE